MNTQKSTIAEIEWNDVTECLDALSRTAGLNKFSIPIGCSKDNKMVEIDLPDDGTGHMLLVGRTGSGKSVYVKYLIAALLRVYGGKIKFAYIDGKGTEVVQWTINNGRSIIGDNTAHLVGKIEDSNALGSILDNLCEEVTHMPSDADRHYVILLDDVTHLMNKSNMFRLDNLRSACAGKKVHVIYSTQILPSSELIDGLKQCALVCATRVPEDISVRMFDSPIAAEIHTRFGSVFVQEKIKIGDTYTTKTVNNSVIEYRTVYVKNDDIRNRCWSKKAEVRAVKNYAGNDCCIRTKYNKDVCFVKMDYDSTMNLSSAKKLLTQYRRYMELITTQMVNSSTYLVYGDDKPVIDEFDLVAYNNALYDLQEYITIVEKEVNTALNTRYGNLMSGNTYKELERKVKYLKKRREGLKPLLLSRDNYVIHNSDNPKEVIVRKLNYDLSEANTIYDVLTEDINLYEGQMRKFMDGTMVTVPVISVIVEGCKKLL